MFLCQRFVIVDPSMETERHVLLCRSIHRWIVQDIWTMGPDIGPERMNLMFVRSIFHAGHCMKDVAAESLFSFVFISAANHSFYWARRSVSPKKNERWFHARQLCMKPKET